MPALFFGLAGVFQKSSTRAGIGIGLYLLCIGFGVVLAGSLFYVVLPDKTISTRSGLFASLIGLSWALGMGLVAVALVKYSAPLSRLVPLYNMNTIVAVLIALVVFSEWKDVSVVKLLAGALLIIAGGTLVARS